MDYGWGLRGAAFIRLQHLNLATSFFPWTPPIRLPLVTGPQSNTCAADWPVTTDKWNPFAVIEVYLFGAELRLNLNAQHRGRLRALRLQHLRRGGSGRGTSGGGLTWGAQK